MPQREMINEGIIEKIEMQVENIDWLFCASSKIQKVSIIFSKETGLLFSCSCCADICFFNWHLPLHFISGFALFSQSTLEM